MPTRNIELADSQDALVAKLVETGRYQSASEVVRDGLRLLEDRLEARAVEMESIRNGILEGLEQAEKGDFAEGTAEEGGARAFSKA